MPDNCKNFSGSFIYKRKSLRGQNMRKSSLPDCPPGPHPLALANSFQSLLDTAVVNSRAEPARPTGLSRARVTQIMNLLLLAPAIQEAILFLPRSDSQRA
ncbi:MAG: hypothetical protein ACYTFZ_10505 [Planctomycetota bacterium]|jgi:hypothetical protein